jgi:hypothetical protein
MAKEPRNARDISPKGPDSQPPMLNYVCLDCRVAVRANDYAQPICSKCRKDLICIGKHWRVPKKKDIKGWKVLRDRIEKAIHRGQSTTYL